MRPAVREAPDDAYVISRIARIALIKAAGRVDRATNGGDWAR